MRILYDEDEFETVTESRPCTSCDGDLRKCNGGCNGYFSMGQRRRDPAEVRRIKAEREKAREDAVLAEADLIRARRSSAHQ